MPLVIAGIDEAGYGPLLGPLCVGMTVLRVQEWSHGDAAPDLWKLLAAGVCRRAGDKRGRVAVDDSKKLKGPNDRTTRHPLAELERGVLTFLACIERASLLAAVSAVHASAADESAPDPSAAPDSAPPRSAGLAADDEPPRHDDAVNADAVLFHRLGAECEGHPWYGGEPAALPLSGSADQIAIAANRLRRTLGDAGVSVLDVRCRAIGETAFNSIVERTGTKSAATGAGVTRHLRRVWNRYAAVEETCEGGARVVCDAQGGRTDYYEYLSRAIPGSRVTVLEQSARRSRYVVEGRGLVPSAETDEPGEAPAGDDAGPHGEGRGAGDARERALTVLFTPEADSGHMTVALASMAAKLTRELMMGRFNRYWCARCPELKPTAGYTLDARRWLGDAAKIVTAMERRAMVRRV